MALFDDLTKKAAHLTEKTIEKSSELSEKAKIKLEIKSAQYDLDQHFITLGKQYYQILKENPQDNETYLKIDQLLDKIKDLNIQLDKE